MNDQIVTEKLVIPDRIHRHATALITALATRAGDLDAGMDAMVEALRSVRPEDRTGVIAAAFLITFSELPPRIGRRFVTRPCRWCQAILAGCLVLQMIRRTGNRHTADNQEAAS